MKQTKKKASYKPSYRQQRSAESARVVKNFAGQSIANLFVLSLYLIITSIFFIFFIFVQLMFIRVLFEGVAINSNKVLLLAGLNSTVASLYLFWHIKNRK